MAEHNQIGQIGEDLACRFLMKHGYSILDRNYRRVWGEIDIVAKKRGVTYFVEVKTLKIGLGPKGEIDPHTTYTPFDNLTDSKVFKLRRIISTYLSKNRIESGKWQFHAVSISYDRGRRLAAVKLYCNLTI